MLLEELKKYRIMLASASPRRQELMRSAGLEFEVISDLNVDEAYPEEMAGKDIPMFLAHKKSYAFPEELLDNDILITADTIVVQNEKVLLKPNTEKEALETISKLSAGSHFVYTGVYLRTGSKEHGFCSETEVVFGSLSEAEILYYIHHFKPYDKAGAYGIQEWIGAIGAEEIRGSYFNVMGLPIHRLYRELELLIKKI